MIYDHCFNLPRYFHLFFELKLFSRLKYLLEINGKSIYIYNAPLKHNIVTTHQSNKAHRLLR